MSYSLCGVLKPLGSCSPVCSLGALCCASGVLGPLAPVHRCTRSVRCVARAVSWATWLLFTGVLPGRVVLRLRCPGPLGLCSPVNPLGVLCACAASWATWPLVTGAYARRVWLRVSCPGPPASCSLVFSLGVLRCVCSVLGPLAPVHRCAPSVCFVECAVSWATWYLFTGALARSVVLRVRCPGPLGSCSPVCSLCALCCVCGVLRHLAPVHQSACSACHVAFAVSWVTWLLFTGVLARRAVLCVRRPWPLSFSSPVCSLGVFCCARGILGHLAPVHWCACLPRCVAICGVLGNLAPVHQCARSVRCVACAVSWASSL